jgi:DNA-binding GntR family transcriptional regulator
MAKIPTLKRRSLGQEVTIVLRQMVQRGELAPGERLVEERLAEQLGLSRTPVREALHRLEQEGLLLKRPRGGYEVRNLTIEEVEEVAGVRAVLAAYAAERAAGRISPEELILLEQNIKDFGQAIEANDEDTLLDLNSDFHSRILQASASPLAEPAFGRAARRSWKGSPGRRPVQHARRDLEPGGPPGIWSRP